MPRRIRKVETAVQEKPDMEEISVILGKNIRRERKARKLTREKFVELMPISESYLGLIERGERTPSLDCLFEFCTTFETTPNELLLPPDKGEFKNVKNAEIENENYKSAMEMLNTFKESELKFLISIMINLKMMEAE